MTKTMNAADARTSPEPVAIDELPTRADLAEAVHFAAERDVPAHVQEAPLAYIERVRSYRKGGQVQGRTVLRLTKTEGRDGNEE